MAKWLRKWRRGWLYVRSNTKKRKVSNTFSITVHKRRGTKKYKCFHWIHKKHTAAGLLNTTEVSYRFYIKSVYVRCFRRKKKAYWIMCVLFLTCLWKPDRDEYVLGWCGSGPRCPHESLPGCIETWSSVLLASFASTTFGWGDVKEPYS